MTEYHDAAHQAYARLKWQEENRPDPDDLAALRKAQEIDGRQRKIARFRRSIA